MRQELAAQLQTIRNELDALTYMLYEAEDDNKPKPEPVSMANDPEYMTVRDVANELGVSSATVYRWAREGIIPRGTQWGPRTRRWSRGELGGGPVGRSN